MHNSTIKSGFSALSKRSCALSKPELVALIISGLLNKIGNLDGRESPFPYTRVQLQELNAKAGMKLHGVWLFTRSSSPPQHNRGRPKDTPRFRL